MGLLLLLFGGPILWLFCAMAAMSVASSKGLSGCGFALLGILLGPVGLLIALIMPPDPEHRMKLGVQRGLLSPCPYCAEPIRREATICRHCGRSMNPLPPEAGLLEEAVKWFSSRIR